MAYDIQAATVTEAGVAVNKRARVKGVSYVTGGTAGSVVLKDGGSGGTAVLTLNTPATTDVYDLMIPDNGILVRDQRATLVTVLARNVTNLDSVNTVLYEG
jgi:hypothetical protein